MRNFRHIFDKSYKAGKACLNCNLYTIPSWDHYKYMWDNHDLKKITYLVRIGDQIYECDDNLYMIRRMLCLTPTEALVRDILE